MRPSRTQLRKDYREFVTSGDSVGRSRPAAVVSAGSAAYSAAAYSAAAYSAAAYSPVACSVEAYSAEAYSGPAGWSAGPRFAEVYSAEVYSVAAYSGRAGWSAGPRWQEDDTPEAASLGGYKSDNEQARAAGSSVAGSPSCPHIPVGGYTAPGAADTTNLADDSRHANRPMDHGCNRSGALPNSNPSRPIPRAGSPAAP